MLLKKKNHQVKPNLIETLYYAHRVRLYWIAYEILKDGDSSQDAVQETFERFIKNIARLNIEDEGKTAALLTVICRNVALDMYRKEKGEELTPLYDNDSSFSETTYNPENLLISKESYNAVMNILEGMDIKYKSVLLLSCGHELSVETIARLLGINFETAKKRLYRARKFIKEELAKMKANEKNIADKIL